jgi:tol-pal system protein YbgF
MQLPAGGRRARFGPSWVVVVLSMWSVATLGACASQVDLSSIRREQRVLARRLADQRADLDRLNAEVARLRQGGAPEGYGTPGGYAPGETYGQPAGYPPGGDRGQPVYGGGQPTYGAAQPGANYGYGASPGGGLQNQPAVPAGSGATDLQTDLARGTDSEYQQGLQSYARGDFQRSVQSLRNYVSRNPRDPLVPVAQYWIGEAYFSQGKYNESILAFNEILVTWPDSDRKPAALLRQAEAFARTGDKIDARMILQKLIEDHPQSPEAAEAKQQLRALGG